MKKAPKTPKKATKDMTLVQDDDIDWNLWRHVNVGGGLTTVFVRVGTPIWTCFKSEQYVHLGGPEDAWTWQGSAVMTTKQVVPDVSGMSRGWRRRCGGKWSAASVWFGQTCVENIIVPAGANVYSMFKEHLWINAAGAKPSEWDCLHSLLVSPEANED